MSQPKIDRRGWLAWFLQKRRRARSAAGSPAFAIALSSDGHGRLTWTVTAPPAWNYVNIYLSSDGFTWGAPYDGASLATGQRDCSGVAGFFRICQADDDGLDVPPYSNAVHSDGL